MDNQTLSLIRSLESRNQASAQEALVARQRIIDLENQIKELTSTDESYVGPETEIEFIRKVAESKSKFAKEAQDILNAIDANV